MTEEDEDMIDPDMVDADDDDDEDYRQQTGGAGYDCDEHMYRLPLEDQIVLRVPPRLAASLRTHIRSKSGAISLSFDDPEGREGYFKMDGEALPFQLRDLPCIVETHKTSDGTTLYKSSDVGQVIVVREKNEEPEPRGTDGHHAWRTASGITAPTHNIVTKSFRKPRDREELRQIERDILAALGKDQEYRTEYKIAGEEEGTAAPTQTATAAAPDSSSRERDSVSMWQHN
eukprot:m51a1_g7536 hypothetical protein (230) ;mRNA; r:54583-56400